MNRCQMRGIAGYIAGQIEEGIGKLIGNARLAHSGHRRQIAGKARKAIGDAQEIIKDCVRRRFESV